LAADRETYEAGARQDLHSPVLVKATVATSVLVTTWR
jgi:mannose-1-phosphate guanylyltransferase